MLYCGIIFKKKVAKNFLMLLESENLETVSNYCSVDKAEKKSPDPT